MPILVRLPHSVILDDRLCQVARGALLAWHSACSERLSEPQESNGRLACAKPSGARTSPQPENDSLKSSCTGSQQKTAGRIPLKLQLYFTTWHSRLGCDWPDEVPALARSGQASRLSHAV